MKTISEYEKFAELRTRIEKKGHAIEREAVVNEALTWLATPFHHGARIKGIGVDCGEFLIAVYSACGIIRNFIPEHYSPQWHLHNPNGEERYMKEILRFGHEVEGPPEAGETAMFHIGRHYAHSAIVIDWPTVIHAPSSDIPGGVQIGDASRDGLLLYGGRKFPPKFFSPWL